MPFCLCQPFDCSDEGLISVTINGSSSSRILPGTAGTTNILIPGPATGTVNIVGYAFDQTEDKWLGVRCPSNAQANQTNYVRYNSCDEKFIIIPSRINSAVVTGDDMNGVNFTEFDSCGTIEGLTASIQNGVTVAQQTTTRFGHSLSFKDFTFPSLGAKEVFGVGPCFIQNLAISSSFPQVAQFNAGYQFIVSC